MEDRLNDYSTTNVNQDDHLEKIEREAYETGNILFRSWTDSLNDGILSESKKKEYKHKYGFNPKLGKDPFGLSAYARELAMGLEEQESEYKVYLDMDGVIADFDRRFEDISGMKPHEFESKFGKKAFWNLIDEDNKISFWVGIKPMEGASKLVNAVKKYNYELLTSPSAKKQSYLGKILWVRNHRDILGGKPKINFRKAKEKHNIKSKLSSNDILIDDRDDTIERWNNAGGTGIHYKSSGQVLNDLKKLGL
jgi:PAS domain-containing protein